MFEDTLNDKETNEKCSMYLHSYLLSAFRTSVLFIIFFWYLFTFGLDMYFPKLYNRVSLYVC